MSGGVDSSVAAALLVEQGHQVVGFTLKLWDAEDEEHARKVCCTTVMARDAGQVCAQLGIPHYTLDLREEFKREVIERFEQDYLLGRTPNPCVHCNSRVKWGRVWQKAQMLKLDTIATGHYAQTQVDEEGVHLRRGLDPDKDQSYFLWEVPREMLAVTHFPLGGMNKSEVREIARRLALPVAEKEESQEVCFIPRDDYRGWLKSRRPDLAEGSLAGEMVDETGKVLGNHEGFPFFTVGQRKGLGLGGGRKLFVTRIDPDSRRVFVGDEEHLDGGSFRINRVNLLRKLPFSGENGYLVKIRYRDPGVAVKVEWASETELQLTPDKPLKSVTPGQSAVIYIGDEVVAGGIII